MISFSFKVNGTKISQRNDINNNERIELSSSLCLDTPPAFNKSNNKIQP